MRRAGGEVLVRLPHGQADLATIRLVVVDVEALHQLLVLGLVAAVHHTNGSTHIGAIGIRVTLASFGEQHQAHAKLVGIQTAQHCTHGRHFIGEGVIPVRGVIQHEQHVRHIVGAGRSADE
ncbi:hypothetical protein D9M69_488490 [compost metagenome]